MYRPMHRGSHARADPLLADHAGAGQRRGAAPAVGQRALVIGGAGKIGGWFAQFLGSQGFRVEIADPAGGATAR